MQYKNPNIMHILNYQIKLTKKISRIKIEQSIESKYIIAYIRLWFIKGQLWRYLTFCCGNAFKYFNYALLIHADYYTENQWLPYNII